MRDQYTIKVRIPATTANCGPGFDTIGMACTLYNEMELSLTERTGLVLEVHGEGKGLIPENETNMAVQAVRRVLTKVGCHLPGIKMKMYNRIPLARGLGSSAAAIVGGLVAANAVTGGQLSREEILDLACQLEGHPDNVAPALYGGVTVAIMVDSTTKILPVPAPQDLFLTAVIPSFRLSTKRARQVLPRKIPLTDAVYNIGRAAMLVGALTTGRWEYLRYAFFDRLHHPYRRALIPGMDDVFAAALSAGAVGVTISGAGPTIMAFSQGQRNDLGAAMVAAFARHGISAQALTLSVAPSGATVVMNGH